MSTDKLIMIVRGFGWMLFVSNVIILFRVKGSHSNAVNAFFMTSIGIGLIALVIYCIARLRAQTEMTRNIIEAVSPMAMLAIIVLGIIVICVLVPMLISKFS